MQIATISVSSAFLRNPQRTAAEKIVYCILASTTNTDCDTSISLRTLSHVCGCAVATVRTAVKRLAADGQITMYTASGMPSVYHINHPDKKDKRTVQIPCKILYASDMSIGAKVVYMILLAYRNFTKKVCCPSIRTIARVCCKSTRTIQRIIASLRTSGAISSSLMYADKESRYPHNEYVIHDEFSPTVSNPTVYSQVIMMQKATKKFASIVIGETAKENAEEKKKEKTCMTTANYHTGKQIINVANTTSITNDTTVSESCQYFSYRNVEELRTQISHRISYDSLIKQHPYDKTFLNAVIQAMCDAIQSDAPAQRIGDYTYNHATLLSLLHQITSDHVELAVERYKQAASSRKIGYPVRYMLSVLIGTLKDIDIHYHNAVMFDMPWMDG